MNVLQNLIAEIIDLRKLEIRVLTDELAHLLIQVGQTVPQCDHLLHEQVAEQREEHAENHGQHQQREQRGDRTFPAMLDQRHHHRLHRERDEQRDDDVDHQIFDLTPAAPAESKHHDGYGDV